MFSKHDGIQWIDGDNFTYATIEVERGEGVLYYWNAVTPIAKRIVTFISYFVKLVVKFNDLVGFSSEQL
jgi:hypothetical protein